MNNYFVPGYATQVIFCKTSDTKRISWSRNGATKAIFDGHDQPGQFDLQEHLGIGNILLWSAIVLENNEQEFTSVIVWTDSVSRFNLSCFSKPYEVEVQVTMTNDQSMTTAGTMSLPTCKLLGWKGGV